MTLQLEHMDCQALAEYLQATVAAKAWQELAAVDEHCRAWLCRQPPADAVTAADANLQLEQLSHLRAAYNNATTALLQEQLLVARQLQQLSGSQRAACAYLEHSQAPL